MKLRYGAWFFGKCSNCQDKKMVRKLKASQVCVDCARQIIKNHGGAENALPQRPERQPVHAV